MLTAMISLDPATITDRSYPLLFQTGETAYGKPLVDAQHPHDFLMALSVEYAHPLDRDTMLQLYYAPVGDPALGPGRLPASRLRLRIAASHARPSLAGFHAHRQQRGDRRRAPQVAARRSQRILRQRAQRESLEHRLGPDEFLVGPRLRRAHAELDGAGLRRPPGASPSARRKATCVRTTASLHTRAPWISGTSWSSSLIWGRNHETFTHRNVDAYLLETLYPVTRRNFLTGRVEVVDKDELALPAQARQRLPHSRLHRRLHPRHRNVRRHRNRASAPTSPATASPT